MSYADVSATVTESAVSSKSNFAVLLSNLRLLDLDKCKDWPNISTKTFANKDPPQNQGTRIQCVEWICYKLYHIWDPAECQNKLLPFFPPFEPLQSINLRAALFRCLNELKRNGVLGGEVYLRKSMFEECKGDPILKVLVSFSTTVLHKVIASDEVSSQSLTARLSLAGKVPLESQALLLPLAIAHKRSLSSLLRKKRILTARYHDFGNAIENKQQDLSQKFEKIVEIQDFLDQNPPSESTIDRVNRVLDQQWQGNRKFLEVIAEGEDHKMSDALLDNGFESIWEKAESGTFDGNISTDQNGLLQDLEDRVAKHQARVEHWKNIKSSFKNDVAERGPIPASNGKKTLISPKSVRYEQRKEKELVFSPRKSPRKSTWPDSSSISPSAIENKNEEDVELKKVEIATISMSSPLAAKSRKAIESENADLSMNTNVEKDHDDSAFSEISANGFERRGMEISSGFSPNSDGELVGIENPPATVANARQITSTIDRQADTSNETAHGPEKLKFQKDTPTKRSEDGKIAAQLVAAALDASLTPQNSESSLLERTRHSMAFAKSDKHLLQRELPTFAPLAPTKQDTSPASVPGAATLAERTRQSVSLVPTQSKRSRDSINVRRTSKIFPTNQFETPRKQSGIRNMTPPEELMSSRAGYDSVFKSRPKVALSPATSPSPECQNLRRLEGYDDQIGDAC